MSNETDKRRICELAAALREVRETTTQRLLSPPDSKADTAAFLVIGKTIDRALSGAANACPHEDRVRELESDNAKLRALLNKADRAIGDHYAPSDCYSTGPLTGNLALDSECPACTYIAARQAAAEGGAL